jgi:hypothetical protein
MRITELFAPAPPSHQVAVQGQQPIKPGAGAEAQQGPDYLAIATLSVLILQAVIYWRQSNIMEEQAEIARRQVNVSQSLERPLMLALPPRFGKLGYAEAKDKGVFPDIEVSFHNYGRSPAIVDYAATGIIIGNATPPPVRMQAGKFFYTDVFSGDTPSRVWYPSHYWPHRGIAPDERIGWFDRSLGDRLTADQIESLASGKQKIWLDGVIFYEDVFGTRRETHFRWVYDPGLDCMILDGGAECNRYT